jgi:two-component system chemotaxis response regulator CheY
MKILVVDDSAVMRKLIIRSIRQAGYGDADVVEAEDGQHALTVADDTKPHLILADWNMPNLTGIEMLRSLREGGSRVTVGFVTSESSAEIRKEAQEAGASFFLSKPIDVGKLEAALAAVGG